jgi:hypothetical protein
LRGFLRVLQLLQTFREILCKRRLAELGFRKAESGLDWQHNILAAKFAASLNV